MDTTEIIERTRNMMSADGTGEMVEKIRSLAIDLLDLTQGYLDLRYENEILKQKLEDEKNFKDMLYKANMKTIGTITTALLDRDLVSGKKE